KTKSSSDTTVTPTLTAAAGTRLFTSAKGKQPAITSKAKSLTALSEVAMIETQQLKLATKRSLQQINISQASASGADEGTGIIPGVPDVPTKESDEEISWRSSDEGDDDDDEEGDVIRKMKGMMRMIKRKESFDPIPKTPENTDDEGNGEENLGTNVGREEGHDEEDEEDELYRDVNINLGIGRSSVSSQFVTSMLNPTHDAGIEDEESFDPIPKTPENSDDKGNGEENLGTNVGREEGHDEEEEEDELYRHVNINLGRVIQTTQEFEDSHVTLTPVNPDGQQQSSS
nr:hypothetical protein [Tanacetum cinerariifolium]